MVWTFFALSAGALAFALKLVIDHLKEADQLNTQITKLAQEQIGVEEKILEAQAEIAKSKSEAEKLKKELDERQQNATTLQAEINHRKGEKARRGQFKV